jgi:hypothetical protein
MGYETQMHYLPEAQPLLSYHNHSCTYGDAMLCNVSPAIAALLILLMVAPVAASGELGYLEIGALTRGTQWHPGFDVPDIYIIHTPNDTEQHYNGLVYEEYILPDGTVPVTLLPPGNYTAFLPYGQGKTLEFVAFDIISERVTYVTFKGYSGIGTAAAGC